jgi:hypothetical protein
MDEKKPARPADTSRAGVCQTGPGLPRRSVVEPPGTTVDVCLDRGEALRLVEKEAPKADTDRKALACYGLLLPQTGTMLLRFVTGRPVSHVPCDDLAWVADRMAHDGKKAVILL